MNDFDDLDIRIGALVAAAAPAGRRSLAAVIAADLQRSQSARIADQQNPDGTPFEPRKATRRLRNKKGRLRRAMFAKLRTARWMKREATADAAVVTFANGVQRMAQVHQHGLLDRVNKTSLQVRYPARRLLGFTRADIEQVGDRVLDHMARGD